MLGSVARHILPDLSGEVKVAEGKGCVPCSTHDEPLTTPTTTRLGDSSPLAFENAMAFFFLIPHVFNFIIALPNIFLADQLFVLFKNSVSMFASFVRKENEE